MLRIVLDTNVLVSALLSSQGNPAKILEMVSDGALKLCLSPPIVAEYQNVLGRKKFRFVPSTVKTILDSLIRLSVEIVPSEFMSACSDPADDKFLDCAIASGSAYLITGNQKHFPKLFRGVQIVSPFVFLQTIVSK